MVRSEQGQETILIDEISATLENTIEAEKGKNYLIAEGPP